MYLYNDVVGGCEVASCGSWLPPHGQVQGVGSVGSMVFAAA